MCQVYNFPILARNNNFYNTIDSAVSDIGIRYYYGPIFCFTAFRGPRVFMACNISSSSTSLFYYSRSLLTSHNASDRNKGEKKIFCVEFE